MKFRLFDLSGPLPFSQGFAISHLAKSLAGKLESAGEAAEQHGFDGALLYVKKSYGSGEVRQSESVWLDDGCSLNCLFKRVNDEPWESKLDGNWLPSDFSVEVA